MENINNNIKEISFTATETEVTQIKFTKVGGAVTTFGTSKAGERAHQEAFLLGPDEYIAEIRVFHSKEGEPCLEGFGVTLFCSATNTTRTSSNYGPMPSKMILPYVFKAGEGRHITGLLFKGSSLIGIEEAVFQQHRSQSTTGDNVLPRVRRDPKDRPCYTLSINVLATYKTVNEVFYAELRNQNIRGKKGVQNGGFDDDKGNYIPVVGEEIADRYIVHQELGRGSFGVVVKCADRAKMIDVALKIIRNRPQFYHQAKLEVEILTGLNDRSTEDQSIVRVLKVFSWKNHPVIVFELLAFSLFDLVRQTNYNGVSLGLVRKFATQLLQTLDFLRNQPQKIIHCDLKPENILLRNPKRSAIKVIDFGSACYEAKQSFTYIQSRFYRAPEVILRLPYTTAIDMWSLGCIVAELHTGLPLFQGRSEPEQLHRITSVLGPIPQCMIEPSRKKTVHFTQDAKTNEWKLTSIETGQFSEIKTTTLADVLGVEKGGPGSRRVDQPGHAVTDYRIFLDFISRLLQLDPKNRAKPQDLLKHEYITSGQDAIAQTAAQALQQAATATAQQGGNLVPLGGVAGPAPSLQSSPGARVTARSTTKTE